MKRQRQEILKINQIFTEHLLKVQEAKYSPIGFEFKEGQQVILDEATVTLSKEKAEELNSEDLVEYENNKDTSPFDKKGNIKWEGRSILISGKKNTNDYLQDIAKSLGDLTEIYRSDLFIIGDWNTPWLFQENDYPPVKKALNYLKSNIEKSFDGGFELNSNDLNEFIPHLFWLIRCNMSMPEFMMSYKNSKTVFSIYKHGNLNLEFYDNLEKEFLLTFFNQRNFKIVEDYFAPIKFDSFEGRQLVT